MFGMKGGAANGNEEKLVRDDESMSQSSDKRDPDATVEKEKAVEEQGPNSIDLFIIMKRSLSCHKICWCRWTCCGIIGKTFTTDPAVILCFTFRHIHMSLNVLLNPFPSHNSNHIVLNLAPGGSYGEDHEADQVLQLLDDVHRGERGPEAEGHRRGREGARDEGEDGG